MFVARVTQQQQELEEREQEERDAIQFTQQEHDTPTATSASEYNARNSWTGAPPLRMKLEITTTAETPQPRLMYVPSRVKGTLELSRIRGSRKASLALRLRSSSSTTRIPSASLV